MHINSEAPSERPFQQRAHSCLQRIQFWIVWLTFILLSIAGWMRMADSITDWYWLSLSHVFPGPRYLALSGGLWGTAGLVAAIWLLVRFSSGRVVATFIALGIVLSYWIDRLFVDLAPLAGSNALFALLLTMFWLGAVALALNSWEVFASLFRRLRRSQRLEGS